MGLTLTDNKVTIFSASYCPYCDKVKKFFKDHKIAFQSAEKDTGGFS